jgi:hypothetical protein
MNKKQTQQLNDNLVKAMYYVECGTPLKDWLDNDEIEYFLQKYSQILITMGVCKPYVYKDE